MASAEKSAAQARRFFVRGRVQGVGFRWFVEREANILGIAGWVRQQFRRDRRSTGHGNEGTVGRDAVAVAGRAAGGPGGRGRGIEAEAVKGLSSFRIEGAGKMPSKAAIDCEGLKKLIREVPDFPKKGILFIDLTTLLKDKRGFATSWMRFRSATSRKGLTWCWGWKRAGSSSVRR